MHKEILRIALPSLISNITVPLLGLTDTAITGHLGSANYLAAIAVATSIFSTLYWLFNFLRMGTGGLTAQALGAQDRERCGQLLLQALSLSLLLGLLFWIFQKPLLHAALWAMDGTAEVEQLATLYYDILIWGAVPNFALFALNGWLIGMQSAGTVMRIALVQNVVNLVFSLVFALGLGWKLAGVAAGTLVSQWVGAALGLYYAHHKATQNTISLNYAALRAALSTERAVWQRFFAVNRNLFLRTLCLVAVMFAFTRFGAAEGEAQRAVNALLLQFFLLTSFVLDAFAYAAEALGGKRYGAQQWSELRRLLRALALWTGGAALLFSLGFALGGEALLHLLTDQADLRSAAVEFLPYLVAMPLVSAAAFVLDGLFIGLTATRAMLTGLAWASGAFFLTQTLLHEHLGAHALWWAFLLYLAVRGGVQAALLPQILRPHATQR